MDLIDTLNVLVKLTKNFIETFEKKFQLKVLGFVRIFQPHFEIHFFLMFWDEMFWKSSRNVSVDFANNSYVQSIWKVRLTWIFASVKKA